MLEDVKVSFDILNPQLLRFEVERRTAPFGLTMDRKLQIHHLGYREAPLYALQQPFSVTTEEWTVDPLPSGRFIDAQQDVGLDMDPAYLDWFGSSGVSQGWNVPWSLPAGSYFMVQSVRRPMRTEAMLMGNLFVPATPNARALSVEDDPIAAFAFGADGRSAPCFDQPLLGFVVLNSTGIRRMEEVFFFNVLRPVSTEVRAGQELVLIIPREGELVINNMDYFPDGSRNAYLERWKASLADAFVSWCTDPHAALVK